MEHAAQVIDFTASAKLIGAGLAAMGMIGAGVGLGILFGSYLQAAIRNPSAAASQQTMLFLGMALTETMGLFFPGGMGVFGAIAMAPIEMISYFVRPVTLALRLFGNMLGGHVVMSLFGSFVVALGLVALSGGIASLAIVPSVLSFAMIVALTGLELVVAFLQAFVFTVLATVYLNEVVNFGHGH